MKQRFSYLDLRIITNEVQRELTNCYLQNVYSLENSSRHFLLKFDAGVNQTGKRFLMVDPGMRYHFTNYQHEPTQQPSHFVQKLRKFLKNRRATRFWVAPASRLMVITFTEGQFYLVFEFFAGGNMILLDKEYRILSLFRVVRDVGANHQDYQIGEQYPLKMDIDAENPHNFQRSPSLEEIREWVQKEKLGKALYSKISDPSSSLIEYYLRKKGLDPKQKLDLADERALELTWEASKESLSRAHDLMQQEIAVQGYVLTDKDGNSLEFEPFAEYFETVHPENKVETYKSYNDTVDKYFGAILSDKGLNKVDQLYTLAETRLEAARNERQNRIRGLELQQTQNQEIGDALQEHATMVDAAISAVKTLVDQGVDWGDAENLIKLEQQKGNAVAQAIHSLQLDKLQATLALDDLKIPVRVDRSAYANARDYFEIRRSAGAKIEKTEQHANKALRSAEIKIKRDLEANLAKHHQAGVAAQLHSIRKPHWFEKFWWFLTSTNHLVIAARDVMQRDLLLRRYFFEGDLAMTSDAPEATLLIIKKNPQFTEMPPQTLLQASAFCVASSAKSWEARSKAPSWYLTRKQVPKVNANGDPISMHDFLYINPRNLVPPSQLEMGMALLWQCESQDANTNLPSDEQGARSMEDEEEFPDTEFNSDEEFPDTAFDSDADALSESDEDHSVDSDNSDDDKEKAAKDTEDANTSEEPEVQSSSAPGPSEHINNLSLEEDPADAGNDSNLEQVGENAEEATEPAPSSTEKDSELIEAEEASRVPASAPKKVRGGKKKLRKYQAQDDEDRLAAMERLGTLKGLQRNAVELESKEQAKKAQQAQLKERKDRRRQAELARINDTSSPPEQQPLPTDLLLQFDADAPIIAAIPMFAPWASIQKAQYKVKLVLGSMKKGKASSAVLSALLNTGLKPPSDYEKKMVAGIRQVDVQQSIAVSRVQLATSTNVKSQAKGSSGSGARGKKSSKNGGGSKKK